MEIDPSLSFDELHRVSTRMVTADIVNKIFRRQQQLTAYETKKEDQFRRKMRQASAALDCAQGEEEGGGERGERRQE